MDLGTGIGLFIRQNREREAAAAAIERMSQLEAPDPNDPEKTVPIFDKAFKQSMGIEAGKIKEFNKGELAGLQRLMQGIVMETQRSRLTAEPKYPTEVVPGETLPLSASGKANVLLQQQQMKAPPAGKQLWEGDDIAPQGYYTPGQIANFREKRLVQKSRDQFSQLRNDINIAKVKTGEKTKELNEFSKAYGFPPVLFDSTTKIYEEGSSVAGKAIPNGYYGFEAVNPKTGDIEVRHIGKEEFKQGKKIWNELKGQRTSIEQLGESIKVKTARARAALDWAEANPTDPRAAAARSRAQAELTELGLIASGGQPSPTPAPEPEEE